ncbi:hypothetical protein [Chlorobium sp. N1]|uniref:hypothetical protein n=1 Tax=Chlorobium sp. N1 TaxID=2491138 RepID=UPI001038D0B7|nr:hypothetical protein [Chlorobium sp. N1]TCD46893.1 hypothetical protein E0L29_10975 [Chlorobium sp. N1]
MNLGFQIKPVENGLRGSLYSVHVSGQEKTEFERFGFKEQFFKKEGSIRDSVEALHYGNGKLRLYCLRWSSVLLIVGYGGVKTTRTYQEDPVLHEAVAFLQEVDAWVAARQKTGEIHIDPDTGLISGDLVFLGED